MVATHIFHELVFCARVSMKKASWSFCVLVIDSSGEPAVHPGVSDSCALGGFGTHFEVGRTSSCEDGADTTINASMDHESSIG